MTLERSDNRRGHAYKFTAWEEQTIAKALKPEILRIDKQIERLRNHPKNEGQATYIEMIRELQAERAQLEEIIKVMES
jgi:hypothetical protein